MSMFFSSSSHVDLDLQTTRFIILFTTAPEERRCHCQGRRHIRLQAAAGPAARQTAAEAARPAAAGHLPSGPSQDNRRLRPYPASALPSLPSVLPCRHRSRSLLRLRRPSVHRSRRRHSLRRQSRRRQSRHRRRLRGRSGNSRGCTGPSASRSKCRGRRRRRHICANKERERIKKRAVRARARSKWWRVLALLKK